MQNTIRIFLIDDQTTLREALRVMLAQQDDFEIVGTAESGESGIRAIQALQPDVALIDIEMPGMNGIEVTQWVSNNCRQTRVIVLSGHDDRNYPNQAFQAGAQGYLLKNTQSEDLASAIRSVHKGFSQISPGLLDKVLTPNQPPKATQIESNSANSIDPEFFLLVQGFDRHLLADAVRQPSNIDQMTSLLLQVHAYLKQDPTNLAALYLRGALARKLPQYESSALQFLRFGFREGIRQGMTLGDLLLFYQEATQIDSQEAWSWITESNNTWNSKEGLRLLYEDETKRSGSDSIAARMIITLHQIRQMKDLNNDLNCLAQKILFFQQEIETTKVVIGTRGI